MKFLNNTWLRFFVIFVVVGVILSSVFYFLPQFFKSTKPVFDDVYILTRKEGQDYAADNSLKAGSGKDVYLYVALEEKKDNSPSRFYCKWQPIKIDGKKIPKERMIEWNPLWGDVFVFWFKIQEEIGTESNVSYEDRLAMDWGFDMSHKADVRTVENIKETPNKPNLGEMFFKVKVEIRNEDEELLQRLETPGAEYLNENKDHSEVLKVRIGEEVFVSN